MDQVQLEQAKERLLRMRQDVMKDVQSANAASREMGQDGVPDIGDMSANTYNRDVLLNLSENQRQKIRDIDAALDRLAQGEYGICARCGDDIAPRRMEVRPFSRYCIDCKTDVEKFGE
jgi:DnaK suppressor protein